MEEVSSGDVPSARVEDQLDNPELILNRALERLLNLASDHAISCGGQDYYMGLNDAAGDKFVYREAASSATMSVEFLANKFRNYPGGDIERTEYEFEADYTDPISFSSVPSVVLGIARQYFAAANLESPSENSECVRVTHSEMILINHIEGYSFDHSMNVNFAIDGILFKYSFSQEMDDDVASRQESDYSLWAAEVDFDADILKNNVENLETIMQINNVEQARRLLRIVIDRTFDGN